MIKEYRVIYTIENTNGNSNLSRPFHGELSYAVQRALLEAKRISLISGDENGPTKVFVDTMISGSGRIDFTKEVKNLTQTSVPYMIADDGRIFVESALVEQLRH
jgi:hypothetical protein